MTHGNISNFNLLDQVEIIDKIISQFHKIESKMLAGQFIPAYRDIKSLMSFFEIHKKNVIAEYSGNTKQTSSTSNIEDNLKNAE